MRQRQFYFGSIFAGILLLLASIPVAATDPAGQLLPSDCLKCHQQQIDVINAQGGKHRDAVSCTDCHLEHPPKGTASIPACSMCHQSEDNPHFTAPDCMGCHPPHRPLEIEFSRAGRVRAGCLSCHPAQGEELSDYPSNHTVLDCKECHQRHGSYVSCLECHESHLQGQSYRNCRECHRPHMPLKVAYKNTIASAACAVCHRSAGVLLAKNRTRHRDFLCVYCHKSQHKQVPTCITCHREPHFQALHERFPDCNECHVGPHNLLN